jgi:diaminohydroxyphosphoribosylaminopyrimidine deaminase/5-amino-6-(5-phosphoribosylamino)uracil reductase
MVLGPCMPEWSQIVSEYWLALLKSTPRDQLATKILRPTRGVKLSEDAAMFLAYAEALRGAGYVAPNPMVGAVLLDKNGGYLSSGAHLRVGGAHAEVEAINQIASENLLDGGTLVVTLEPCSHHGRTPPCADMIARTGIKTILFGLKDPNPVVNGAGEQKLRSAGKIARQLDRWSGPCEWLTRVFITNQTEKRIYVGMKVASTPLGVIAGDKSSRLWITNERSRQMGHFLRLEYDAICVGSGTAILDDPRLDVRCPEIDGRMPLRIVVDGQGLLVKRMPPLQLLTTAPERTLVILPNGSPDTLERAFGVNVLRLPLNERGQFNWKEVGEHLWKQGITSLLLEGGAGLYESADQQSFIDALHWFVAPDGPVDGLKWPVNSVAFQFYKKGGGVPLEGDRLVEVGLGMGGTNFV